MTQMARRTLDWARRTGDPNLIRRAMNVWKSIHRIESKKDAKLRSLLTIPLKEVA